MRSEAFMGLVLFLVLDPGIGNVSDKEYVQLKRNITKSKKYFDIHENVLES